jgi:DNA polymerase (family 10)
VIKALKNKYVTILGHPTGRIIGEREPIEIDLDEIMHTAVQEGCALEINAQPNRLDLSDIHIKKARGMKLKLAISTDAHTPADLDNMFFGVGQARRGWQEKKDVLNTHSWSDLKKIFAH